jgi:SpoVK/Ycf46/Vps4 family AAA+-type ATPase
VEPARYRAFLKEGTGNARDLLPAEHEGHDYDDRLVPAFSWHAIRWEGHDLELAVPPATNGRTVVAVGASPEVLRAFGRELEGFCERPEGRALVYASGHWASDPALDAEIGRVSWDEVVLPEGLVREVRAATEGFFSRREAYRSLGFAWRRGVLFVGPPGTGKTMVTKAIAASVGSVPFLYVRDLSGRRAEEHMIGEVFGRARRLAPCVLVFEDIDGFVDDRNRAVFLNELDGFKDNDGMLVLASSNHPERVDEALLKRPSRFDRVFRVGLPAEAQRREYCLRLLARPGVAALLEGDASGGLGAEGLADEVARATGGFTPAHLKEAFVGAALEVAHGDAAALHRPFAEGVIENVGRLKRQISESREPERLAEASDPSRPRPGFGAGAGG